MEERNNSNLRVGSVGGVPELQIHTSKTEKLLEIFRMIKLIQLPSDCDRMCSVKISWHKLCSYYGNIT